VPAVAPRGFAATRVPASSTATLAPRRASASAADRPVKPPPTMATSTRPGSSRAWGTKAGAESVQ